MSLRLWLVRHGQTRGNDEQWVQGRVDIPLNGRGHEQARQLAERLASIPLQAIYSSPLGRARETAAIIGQRCGVSTQVMDELAEIEMGAWEQKPFTTINSGPEALGERWVFGPDRHLVGSQETLADVIQRGRRVLTTLYAQHVEGDVCAVAHAGIILGIISACLGLSEGAFLPPILVGNASISLVEHRLGRWLLLFANDQHHLNCDWRPPDDMLLMLFGRPDSVALCPSER